MRQMEGDHFTEEEAREVGDELGIDWDEIDIAQFRRGMDVELEHGAHDPETNVTDNDPLITGKIALAHLKEIPDYYDRLDEMEAEAQEEAEWDENELDEEDEEEEDEEEEDEEEEDEEEEDEEEEKKDDKEVVEF